MPFWTAYDKDSRNPKRAFRFVLQITALGGDSGTSVVWFAKKIDKPSFTLSESEHKYLNHSYYFPGKVSWNEITATVVDPADPDALELLAQAIEGAGYRIPGLAAAPSTSAENEHLFTVGKAKSISALGVVNIFQIDEDGQVIEQWKLHQAWIKEIKPSALDYDGEDLSTVDVILRYDWAQLGVGSQLEIKSNSDSYFGKVSSS